MARNSLWAGFIRHVCLRFGLLTLSFLPGWAGPEGAATEILRPSAQRNGLLQQVVTCLERDRLGRVWAGTRNGPFVYNGRRWTPLALPAAAPSRQVRAILETQDGSIWFGTQEGGLWRLNQGRWQHFDSASGLPADRVNTLVEWGPPTEKPSLWVGTSGGVVRWSEGKWWPASQGLRSGWAWKFRVLTGDLLPKGLWVATQGGLARWEATVWVPYQGPMPSLDVNDVIEVEAEAGQRHLWVGFWNLGPGRWDGRSWKVFGPQDGFPSVFPATLIALPDGKGGQFPAVGTYDHGLALFRKGEWKILKMDQVLSSDGVFALLQDPGGNHPFLWVGTRGGGVTTLGLEGRTRSLDVNSGLPGREVQALLATRFNREGEAYWFGTDKGLARWKDDRWQTFSPAQGLPSPVVSALAEGSDGTLWIGTGAGLGSLSPGASRIAPQPAPLGRILALLAEGPRVWIGTRNGLWRLEHGHLAFAESQPANISVTALAHSGAALWIGTRGQGLLQLQDGRWTRHDPNPNFPNSSFASLLFEPGPGGKGVLWAGTLGNGVARLDLAQPTLGWTKYSTRSKVPLLDNMGRALARDRAGDLYLGTGSGLARLRFEADGTTLKEVEILGSEEGVPPRPCFIGAAVTDGQGQVWFGFPEGALALRPKPEEPINPLPPPLLERVLLHGKEFDLPLVPHLTHRQNHLAFEFFLPWYFREDSIHFRSQLRGLEGEPTPWGHDTRREFSALGSGRYNLRVWARDHLGRETPPLELAFRIKPAPWFHPLAFIGYAFLALAAVALFVRLRTRYLYRKNLDLEAAIGEATRDLRLANLQLEAANEEKNQFLGIAAHDLKNPLNGIMLMMEVLEGEEDLGEIETIRSKVHAATRRMADLIGNLLNVNALESGHRRLASRPVNLQELAADTAQEFHPAATAKGLRIEIEGTPEPCIGLGDPDTLREVAANLVSNALKFMPTGPPARTVKIRTGIEGQMALFEVQDEGPGFTEEDKANAFGRFVRLSAQPTSGENSTGLGLAIVKQLVEAMGGSVSLESQAGHGATMKVMLPRPSDP